MKNTVKSIDSNIAKKEQEILLDHVWVLFENLDYSISVGMVESALYFVTQHDFDIKALPPELKVMVSEKIRQGAKESYCDDMVASLDDEKLRRGI